MLITLVLNTPIIKEVIH